MWQYPRMKKTKKRHKPERDENQMAFDVVADMARIQARLASRPPKDPAAQALGRKGGIARKRNLSPEQLAEIGRKGANAKWAKHKKETVAGPTENQ
jgi:general stress protein YciG